MNVNWILIIVLLKQHVQIQLEVLIVLVILDIQEMEQVVWVESCFIYLIIEVKK